MVSTVRASFATPTFLTAANRAFFSKNYRKPLLQRYVVRILLMLVLGGSLESSGVKGKIEADQAQGANLCGIIMDGHCIAEGSSIPRSCP
jgi:hypothetical protein